MKVDNERQEKWYRNRIHHLSSWRRHYTMSSSVANGSGGLHVLP